MASVDIYQMTTKDTNHKVAPVTIFDAVVNPLNKKTLDQEFEDMVGAKDESVAVDDADATLVTTALRKTEQVLTQAEKKQVRTNINAADADDLIQLSETVSENKTNTDAKLSELGSKVGFFNVNDYNNKTDSYTSVQEAMDAIPTEARHIRLVWTALINEQWVVKQFWGGNVNSWNENACIDFIGESVIKNNSISSSKLQDKSVTRGKIADKAILESNIGDYNVSRMKLSSGVQGELNNTSLSLGIDYIEIEYNKGYYIDLNGIKQSDSSFYLSNPFYVVKGQAIKVITSGGYGYTVVAKDNGNNTFTPLIKASVNGVNEFEYEFVEDCSVVVSSAYGRANVVFKSSAINDIHNEVVTDRQFVFGKDFSNDTTLSNAVFYSIKDNKILADDEFEKAEVLIAGKTTVHCVIIDAETKIQLDVADVSSENEGIVTITANDFNFNFKKKQIVELWFYTDTYPRLCAETGITNGNFVQKNSLSETTSENSARNFNAKIYIRKYSSKLIHDVDTSLGIANPIVSDLQEYINSHRDCFIPCGTYKIDKPLVIPSNTHLYGVKGATKFILGSASEIISIGSDCNNVQIDNISFKGKTDNIRYNQGRMSFDSVRQREGIGTDCGIVIRRYAKNVNIDNCSFTDFGKSALYFDNTNVPSEGNATKVSGCDITKSWAGIILEGTTDYSYNSEYMSFVNIHSELCKIGLLILGGNNQFSCCHFKHNTIGVAICGTNVLNDGHGILSCCEANHCLSYSMVSIDSVNGFTINGCNFYDGGIGINNSKAVHICGSVISGDVTIEDCTEGLNVIQSTMFADGVIVGDTSNLSLNGNRYTDGRDHSGINNNI